MKRFVCELIQVAYDALYKTKEQEKNRLENES